MKQRKLFDITEPYSKEQYNEIYYKVMSELDGHAVVAYQSNWLMIIACSDQTISTVLILQLLQRGVKNSYIDVKPGKKHKERRYVQVKFKRIK